MKFNFKLVLLAFVFATCNKDDNENDDIITQNPQENIPTVKSNATYTVLLDEDVTYAEGLFHESLNSAAATTKPLKLDVYYPFNDLENRPVYFFIHGGGFVGGSKQQTQVVNLASYYTSRGWVFVSIDYRLRDDNGTVPQEWEDFATNLPAGQVRQFLAIYPAQRDTKAALRWLVVNAERYGINTDYITAGGGSAGAITAVTLGVTNQEDFRDEMDINQDPTLSTSNLEQPYQIKTIIDLWGSNMALEALYNVYGHQRFDSNDPPLFIAHGTEDPTVPFSKAEDLKAAYDSNGVVTAYYPLAGLGHGPWNATVGNKRLEELAFDFIVEQQNLLVN